MKKRHFDFEVFLDLQVGHLAGGWNLQSADISSRVGKTRFQFSIQIICFYFRSNKVHTFKTYLYVLVLHSTDTEINFITQSKLSLALAVADRAPFFSLRVLHIKIIMFSEHAHKQKLDFVH